jgi:hypothetical protein
LPVLFISTAIKGEEKFYCAIKRGFIFLDKFIHVFNLNSKHQFTGELRIVERLGFQFICLLFLSDFDHLWTVLPTAVNVFTTDLRRCWTTDGQTEDNNFTEGLKMCTVF